MEASLACPGMTSDMVEIECYCGTFVTANACVVFI